MGRWPADRVDLNAADLTARALRRGNVPIAVEPQVFDVLRFLLENRERVVSKSDLFELVWRGRTVADLTLASRINAARRAVGDNATEQRLIRTIARRGIRFVGEVESPPGGNGSAQAPAPRQPKPRQAPPSLPLTDRPAIAVLAFVNMSGDPEQEHFSDGITEDIITALSKLRWFFVIARNSSFIYKGQTVPRSRSPRSSASAMSSKAACARPVSACASRFSSMTSRPAAISGVSATIATWRMFSPSRTR